MASNEAKKQVEKADYIAKRDIAIVDVINRATVFPVPLPVWNTTTIARGKELGVEYPTGVITFDASKGEILIGDKKFSLKVKPFIKYVLLMPVNIDDAKITDIAIKGDNFELIGKSEKYKPTDLTLVSKSEMSELIIALLNGNTDKTKFSDKIAFKDMNVAVA